MRGRRILFHDPDPKVLRVAERALVATGALVDLVDSDGKLAERLAGGGHDLVMLNFDPPMRADPDFCERLDALAGQATRPKIVLHTTAQSEDYLPLMAERRYVRNLIAKNDQALAADELITTASKLLRGDLFGLDKYLAWGIEPFRMEIRDSREKLEAVAKVAEQAERLGVGPRTVSLVETIVDELVTNAIYNAPRDAEGRARYAEMSRREPVELPREEAAVLDFACDGSYIGISLLDPFGSLTQETIVRYLNRCLVERAPRAGATAETWGRPGASGGAGLGLYRVFQSLSKFIVNVEPGRRTEVITLIDLGMTMKKFRQAGKSFHVFIAEGAA
jgi:CheY-like chemotaxis protein